MKKVQMNKKEDTQDQIKKALVQKLFECVNGISERQEKKGIPKNGLTVFVAEIGVDGRKYDMTIALTPDGVFNAFQKSQIVCKYETK